jgi:uncharacterized protein (TIGR02246 family)
MILSFLSRLLAFATLILALVPNPCARTDPRAPLSASDVAAIRAVLERYRVGWLAGNPDTVRSCFAQDAVLLPHHGVLPVVGMAAINEFWFPASSAKTTITKFVQTLDEVGGEGTLAYVRGRSEVAWRAEDGAHSQNWRNGGNFLAVLKKQADGKWLMSHLIWDDPPNQQVN